ncbi:unnamed protein product [Miscanthus lutarioriparius]|uniref:Exostosin GT47 domain-containing protein n=1 Tax=Miscanthus lutarioriparius TaxID=422564 RepID=A0A811S4X7_9POAL|nr:unnamed protein product [Miscanthus lutarioriparius]
MAPECSRRDASPSATLLIVSVALYTVLAAASSPKAVASSSALSSRAAPEQRQLPLSADLTTELYGDGEAVQSVRVRGRRAADPARRSVQEHLHHRGALHLAARAHGAVVGSFVVAAGQPLASGGHWRPDVGTRARPRLLPAVQRLPDGAQFAYRPNTYDKTPLRAIVADYVRVVASRHPYWNRSAGADHFMLACHDWGPAASRGHPELYANGIRAICNANTSEGFRPGQDVSVPDINLYDGEMPRELLAPAAPGVTSRPFLAFFPGGRHGHIRDLLLRHWKDRDPDVFPVYEHRHDDALDYYSFMRRARFCLCPSGFEVASPRVVEAIHAE